MIATCVLRFLALLLLAGWVNATPVRVGYPFFNPPFVISTNEGFDIELIHMICAKLPEGCAYFPAEYSKVIEAVREDKVDIAIGGFTMSTNGATDFVYSIPYKISAGQFVVMSDSHIASIDALKQVKVGCIVNSTYEDYLVNNYSDQMTAVPFKNTVQLINALANGDIKAAFLDKALTNYWLAHNQAQFSTVGKPMLTGSGYAIIGPPKSLALMKRINKILTGIEKDGQYAKIYDAYF